MGNDKGYKNKKQWQQFPSPLPFFKLSKAVGRRFSIKKKKFKKTIAIDTE